MNSLSLATVNGGKTDPFSKSESSYPVKVAIVDDEQNDRRMLCEALKRSVEFVCVGAFRSADEALAEIPKVLPHVVLMDIRMPGMDGHECTRRLKLIMARLKIIIVTGLLDVNTMNRALQAGADGYLTKPIGGTQLLAMLKLTVRQGTPVQVKSCKTRARPSDEADTQPTGLLLTVRENQVMVLLSKGLLAKEISDQLGISFSAVHKHQLNSYRKLGAHNRTEALNNWRDNNHP